MKKHKATEKYSILIVPGDRSSVRKMDVGNRLLGVLIAVSVGCFAIFTASIIGFIHYRNAYIETEQVRLDAAN